MTKTRKKASKKARKSEPQKPSNASRIDALDHALKRLEQRFDELFERVFRSCEHEHNIMRRQIDTRLNELPTIADTAALATEKAVARLIARGSRS